MPVKTIKIKTLDDMALGGAELEFDIEVSPPGPMVNVEVLETSLQTNRDLLDQYHKDLIKHVGDDYFKRVAPWELPYHSLLKNAATARLTIDNLIPAISLRGGVAKFTQLEAKPASLHVEILMKKASKAALSESVGNIPISTVVILSFLVACAAMGYMFLTDTKF